ncbi:MAG: selenium-dependent molybdenum cofactor biosynthesis protein YqeB [Bacillota bacterium]
MGKEITSKRKKIPRQLVLIKGAGDLASGVAHRLYQSGFKVVMTEKERPTVIRRTVSFAQAVFDDEVKIEGVQAKKVEGAENINTETIDGFIGQGVIPVIVDPHLVTLNYLTPEIFIEGTLSKKNIDTTLQDAPLVIALGPGFKAGREVHAVVETRRGHYLGRVIYSGEALPNDGQPGMVGGYSVERLLKAPVAGVFRNRLNIGDMVTAGEVAGYVGETPVPANISGVIRGLINENMEVKEQMKIGDVDPRAQREHCFSISDKARAVGGGVLEAILACER